MFTQIITDTPFWSDCAADHFEHRISGNDFVGDVTFISTARALLDGRMPKEDSLKIFHTFGYYDLPHGGTAVAKITKFMENNSAIGPLTEGTLDVHDFRGTRFADGTHCYEVVQKSFLDAYPGWTQLTRVTDFFKKSFNVLCFAEPEKKNVIIFLNNVTMSQYHHLQSATLGLFPWYFKPEDGVDVVELELLESLRGKSEEKYLDCLEKFAGKYDFRKSFIEKHLNEFENSCKKREIANFEARALNLLNDIRSANNRVMLLLIEKETLDTKITGLKQGLLGKDGESEIKDYFLHNKKLTPLMVGENSLRFLCWGYVEYYDEDLAEKIIENRDSYIYERNGIIHPNADRIQELLRAVFLDKILKLRFCAAYGLELGRRVDAVAGFNYGYEFQKCMPNPHIDKYACMGNYTLIINQMLENHDHIGAIEQCVASCSSLNFSDSTVMSEFMRRLDGRGGVNCRCIELPDGSVVTMNKAIEWLSEQENENEQTN